MWLQAQLYAQHDIPGPPSNNNYRVNVQHARHMPQIISHDGCLSSSTRVLLLQLGKRIQAVRKAKEWTQTDLAFHLDMNRGHTSDIDCGKREAGITTLQVIAQGLETTMAKLLKDL